MEELSFELPCLGGGQEPLGSESFSLHCLSQAPAPSKAPDLPKEQVLKGDSIEIQGSDFFTAFVLCVDYKLRSDNVCCLRAADTGEGYAKSAAVE